jgi:hypothetical protein
VPLSCVTQNCSGVRLATTSGFRSYFGIIVSMQSCLAFDTCAFPTGFQGIGFFHLATNTQNKVTFSPIHHDFAGIA